MSAGGADEAVGPAPGSEMPGTGGFVGKARLEGGAGHGAVIFPAAGHDRTLHEHAAAAHQKLNISSNRAQKDKSLALFGVQLSTIWNQAMLMVWRANRRRTSAQSSSTRHRDSLYLSGQ